MIEVVDILARLPEQAKDWEQALAPLLLTLGLATLLGAPMVWHLYMESLP